MESIPDCCSSLEFSGIKGLSYMTWAKSSGFGIHSLEMEKLSRAPATVSAVDLDWTKGGARVQT